jgi:Rrf2 family protein
VKISTKGRYALTVMIDLAMHNDGTFHSLRDIALRQEISNKYLEQIISKLNKKGFLEVARGNAGGYKLAKQPNEYIIGDILRATEGDLAPIYCLSEGGQCNKLKKCKTLSFWKGLDNVINEYVDSKTLEDLIK